MGKFTAKTHEQFIEEAEAVHDSRYDYFLVILKQ